MNNTKLIFGIAIVVLLSIIITVADAQTYNLPDRLSPYNVAEWTSRGQFIASGTYEPTSVASEGNLFWNTATPTAPILWVYQFGAWNQVSNGLGDVNIPNNASFTLLGLGEKDYSSLDNTPTSASWTLNGLFEKDYSSLGGKPTSASWTLAGLFEKDFSSLTNTPTTLSGYGITDAAEATGLAAHVASDTDPHSANMKVTESITVGDGTDADAYLGYVGTATPVIGDYYAMPFMTDEPVATTTGTLTFWASLTEHILKIHNGTEWFRVVTEDASGTTLLDVLKLAPRASAPTIAEEGMIYQNSSDHHLYVYNGTSWVQLDN